MDEFSLIDRFFKMPQDQTDPSVIVGIGDDCAVLEIPHGYQLVVSMDTLVEGVHFPKNSSAYDIACKALAVNLSDCASAGAQPLWATLSLTLPEAKEEWLNEFAQAFFVMAKKYGVSLIGGDTCKGPLSITIQIHGIVPKGEALLRSQAKAGDYIYVTGTLGDAGLALQTLFDKHEKLSASHQIFIESRLNRPTPRVEIGKAIRKFAHACIDISDGLAADLSHILKASNLGAIIDLSALPLSDALKTLPEETTHHLALNSGDDYELCFTIDPEYASDIQKISDQSHTAITRIGEIQVGSGLFIKNHDKLEAYQAKGYKHFD